MDADPGAISAREALLMMFLDRRDAGRRLAVRLARLAGDRPLVVALPRGGVPVAFEVARRLGAPLDVLAVRKLGAPDNPEFGVGAIAEDGTAVLDAASVRRVRMTEHELRATVAREVRELRRRVEEYRDGRLPLDVRDRTVIVVDDGLATGLTDLAAVRTLRARGAQRIVVAVPVGSREAVAMLSEEADEVVCHTIPDELLGVGRFYQDFSPVPDAEVLALLADAARDWVAMPGQTPLPDERIMTSPQPSERELLLDAGGVALTGDLMLPSQPHGLVIFAHGSGSSRFSPRNRAVAATLNQAGLATLLFDLLTEREARRRELVFDSLLLADRLAVVTDWAAADPATRELPIGYFGASTGAAAALRAAGRHGEHVGAVVSRGGRADLAGELLALVRAPTLLIVGGRDPEVLALNRRAAKRLRCPHRITVVEGAGHLFEEPGTLETVATLAADWFTHYLQIGAPPLAAAGG